MKRLRLPSLNYFKKENRDGVFKMSLSPGGKHLAVVHLSGKFSLWHMPSLKLMKMWDHSEQVRFRNTGPDHFPGYHEAGLHLCVSMCELLVFLWGGSCNSLATCLLNDDKRNGDWDSPVRP